MAKAAPHHRVYLCNQYFTGNRAGRFTYEFLCQWRHKQPHCICIACCFVDGIYGNCFVQSNQKRFRAASHVYDKKFCINPVGHYIKVLESVACKLYRYTTYGPLSNYCMAWLDVEFADSGMDYLEMDKKEESGCLSKSHTKAHSAPAMIQSGTELFGKK